MGRPNRETESVRAIREDRARSRLDQLTEEVDRLRQELPGGTEDVWNRDEARPDRRRRRRAPRRPPTVCVA
ncbi:MAG: hypothetical protein H6515_06170 [Microthrixaceae bacterium]|nr:hypothetical protein [Microthrixaceae bacterium]